MAAVASSAGRKASSGETVAAGLESVILDQDGRIRTDYHFIEV